MFADIYMYSEVIAFLALVSFIRPVKALWYLVSYIQAALDIYFEESGAFSATCSPTQQASPTKRPSEQNGNGDLHIKKPKQNQCLRYNSTQTTYIMATVFRLYDHIKHTLNSQNFRLVQQK